jgi:hypothetical protein
VIINLLWSRWVLVVHSVILAAVESEIRRTAISDQLGQKSSGDFLSMEKSWARWHASVIPVKGRKPKIGG